MRTKQRIAIIFGTLTIFTVVNTADALCTPSGDGIYTCDATITSVYSDANKYIVNVTGDSGITPLKGFGAYISDRSFLLNELVVTTNGSGADAVRVRHNANVNIGQLTIRATGNSADGINVTEDANASIVTIGSADIIVYGSNGGVGVRNNLARKEGTINVVTIGDNLRVETFGNGRNSFDSVGYGVYAGMRSVYQNSQKGGAILSIGRDSTIITHGSAAHGVYANRGGEITLGHGTKISTEQQNAYGIYAESASTGMGVRGGKVNLLGDVAVTVPDGGRALYASGTNTIASEIKSINPGVYRLQGEIRADNAGLIDLRLNDGSFIKGNARISGGGTIKLTMKGGASAWHMTGNSQLTDLNLDNGAQVFFGRQDLPMANTDSITLSMNNLSGSGIFNMRTNIVETYGDFIEISGTARGIHGVMVADHSTGGATGNEVLTLIRSAGGDAVFNLLNRNMGGTTGIDVGPYVYGLSKRDLGGASEWYLSPIETVVPPGPGPGPNPGPEPGPKVDPKPKDPSIWPLFPQPILTNAANHSVSILNINYLLMNAETHTLAQRLGALRDSNAEGDVWARFYGGKFSSFASKFQGFNYDYSGIQLGVDKRIGTAGGDLYLGGMMGLSQGKANYDVGEGKTRSYHFGLYATYKHANEFYIDGVIKYNNIRNSFDTLTGAGYAVHGKGTSKGLAVSIEAGKRFYFTQKQGWYMEPQIQLSYAHQGATTIRSSNNLTTHLESFDSLIGRMSVAVGYNLKDGENPLKIYWKTGFAKEFKGNMGYAFNGGTGASYKLNGQWWDNTIGIDARVNKRHSFYADVNYAKGNRFDKVQFNAGYRYAF